MKHEKEIKQFVKDRYAKIASRGNSCCPSCVSTVDPVEQTKSRGVLRARS